MSFSTYVWSNDCGALVGKYSFPFWCIWQLEEIHHEQWETMLFKHFEYRAWKNTSANQGCTLLLFVISLCFVFWCCCSSVPFSSRLPRPMECNKPMCPILRVSPMMDGWKSWTISAMPFRLQFSSTNKFLMGLIFNFCTLVLNMKPKVVFNLLVSLCITLCGNILHSCLNYVQTSCSHLISITLPLVLRKWTSWVLSWKRKWSLAGQLEIPHRQHRATFVSWVMLISEREEDVFLRPRGFKTLCIYKQILQPVVEKKMCRWCC